MMLLIIAAGYILGRLGKISQKTRAELIDLVIYIILPCNIFTSFEKGIPLETLKQCGTVLIAATALQAVYLAANRVLFRRAPRGRSVIMQYAMICNNAGFMGLPVIEAVFGKTGLLYGAIVLIPIRIFMWTSGLSLFTETGSTRHKIKMLATHPCIWTVLLGFIYVFVPFELPPFLMDALRSVGGCITALTMIIVGLILAEVDPKTVLDRDCFYFSAIRLIAVPALAYGVMTLLGVDKLVVGVTVLSSAMPAATTTAMLASKYNGDAPFASKLLFVSTVLSMITLPFVSMIVA